MRDNWVYRASFAPLDRPRNPAAGDPPGPPPSTRGSSPAAALLADALESVLSENTRRVYGAQWRIFTDWCADVGLRSLPAEPLTVPATWPPAPVVAPASPPCAWPRPPFPRPTSGRATNHPAGTRACLFKGR